MGLDITVYQRVRPAEEDAGDAFTFSVTPEYKDRANGVPAGPVSADESFSFHAGSYSGYNTWRNQLARLAGYPAVQHSPGYKPPEMSWAAGAWETDSGPFWELINFSDCEGTIGPRVAFKLANDFAEFQAKADAHDDEYFRAKYAEWRKAFETAREFGAVEFH